MGLFNFGRKLDIAKEYSFEDIPVFSSLTHSEQRMIQKKARLVEFKRGDVVYKEKQPSEYFYVVISGRFRLYGEARNDPAGDTIAFFYRGEHFGEASLLSNTDHNASCEAKSDGVVLMLTKEDFLKFVEEIPSLSLYLNRSLGHRLTKKDGGEGLSHEVKIAGLYAQTNQEDSFHFWMDLSGRLTSETSRKVIVVDFVTNLHGSFKDEFQTSSIESFNLSKMDPTSESDIKKCLTEHPDGFYYLHVPAEHAKGEDERKVAALLTFLTYRYEYIMVRLLRDVEDVTFQTLKQSDMVYVYCSSETEDLISCSETLVEFQKSFGFTKKEIKVVLPGAAGNYDIPYEEKQKVLGFRIFSILPSKTERAERYQRTIRYIARELAEKLVGLALGSGAAYGLSHIGLLRVIEEENIPIDVVAGSSIGALIGAFWGAGFDSKRLESIARSITRTNGFFKLIGFSDLSLAHRGFLKGNQVTKFLESYIGDMKIEDLNFPVKIVATDFFSSKEVVLDSGRVVDAIRASISIPGIVRPFHYKGMCLIDGGVIDPLPTRVLAKMGINKIIGVNVLSSPKDRMETNRIQSTKRNQKLRELALKNPMAKGVSSMFYKFHKRYADNTFNVIMHTIQFMEYELAEASASECDVHIHPEISEGHWAEFYEHDKFINAGEAAAREQLDAIKQIIAE